MTHRQASLTAFGCAIVMALFTAPTAATLQEESQSPLTLVSSRVSIAGTSNIHAYTASTTAARIVRLQLASGPLGTDAWQQILKPGVIDALEIAIPAASLASPKEGIDQNMHKALKVTEHPDITFRLSRFEGAGPDAFRALGILTIAGVEREVSLDLKTLRNKSTLIVNGEIQLLMTDFGVTPPKAMLGMLKTDPKVTVTFETTLAIPQT